MVTNLHVHITASVMVSNKIIYAISLDGNKWFKIPSQLESIDHHKELMNITKIKSAVKQIESVGKYRRVAVELTQQLRLIYVDEQNDLMVSTPTENFYLEEILVDFRKVNVSASASQLRLDKHDVELKDLLHQLILEKSENYNKISLKNIKDRILIKPFDGKVNADQWILSYEQECSRLEIKSDIQKIECLKAVLDDKIRDWYDANVLKLPKSWSSWKESFVSSYSLKGWSDVRMAFAYKYRFGSLVDYANAKERRLLEVDSAMPEKLRILLIVYNLPLDVQEKIDREKTINFEKLISRLIELDDSYQRKSSKKIENSDKNSQQSNLKTANSVKKSNTKSNDLKPCTFCESIGKPNRYHPLEKCYFKKQPDKFNGKPKESYFTEYDRECLDMLLEKANHQQNSDNESTNSKN